jgi:hypothetical protein
VNVDRLLVTMACHHLEMEAAAQSWDEDRVFRECMQEWSQTHVAFAEEEYAAWECLHAAELSVKQGQLIAALAADCIALLERELEDLDRKLEASGTRIEAAKAAVDEVKYAELFGFALVGLA